ncbi:hypothetical protein BHM03_00038584, partial [Ensete ventricosum]
MQGLVHGRQSVRGHPKARSELGAMEHQNFLFDMERIRPYAAEMCNKFNTLLDLEGCSMIRAAGEWDCFSAHIRLREPGKSEDKA